MRKGLVGAGGGDSHGWVGNRSREIKANKSASNIIKQGINLIRLSL